jgi:hypothetical protein
LPRRPLVWFRCFVLPATGPPLQPSSSTHHVNRRPLSASPHASRQPTKQTGCPKHAVEIHKMALVQKSASSGDDIDPTVRTLAVLSLCSFICTLRQLAFIAKPLPAVSLCETTWYSLSFPPVICHVPCLSCCNASLDFISAIY